MGVVFEKLVEGVFEDWGGGCFAECFAGCSDEAFPPLAFSGFAGGFGGENGVWGGGEGGFEGLLPRGGWMMDAVFTEGAGVGCGNWLCGVEEGFSGIKGDPAFHFSVCDGVKVEAIGGGAEGCFAAGEAWGLIEVGCEVFVKETALGGFHGRADEHADHFIEKPIASEVETVAIG